MIELVLRNLLVRYCPHSLPRRRAIQPTFRKEVVSVPVSFGGLVSGSTKLGSLCLHARCRANELALAHLQSLRQSSKETALIRSVSVESFRRVYLHRKGRRRWFTRTRPAAWVMWEGSSAAATTVRMGCLYSFPLSPEDEEVLALVASLEKECLNSGIVIMLSEAAVKKQEQQRDL